MQKQLSFMLPLLFATSLNKRPVNADFLASNFCSVEIVNG